MFAVDDPTSLDEAKDIIKELQERNTKKAPILLVANKIDLYECEEQWAAKESRIYALKNELHFAALSATNLPQVITPPYFHIQHHRERSLCSARGCRQKLLF